MPQLVIEAPNIPYHLLLVGAIVGAVIGAGLTVALYAIDAKVRQALKDYLNGS